MEENIEGTIESIPETAYGQEKETLLDTNDAGLLTVNGGGDEPALSVTSDSLSEQEFQEYSSDSGKGCSGSDTLTPVDESIEGEAKKDETWQMCPAPYTSYAAYSDSLGKVFPSHAMIYEFDIPQSIVGRLIGKHGSFLNKIKATSGANIIVKRHHNGSQLKICAVEGVSTEIDKAISMIRERFPFKKFPSLTLEQINNAQIPPSISFLPSNNKLNLIDGVVNDVTVSCVVSLEHIFLNQPTHPTYPALSRLHQSLKAVYEQPVGTPKLSRPFNAGVICVAQLNQTNWYRAEVVALQEDKCQVTARLVDIGGYVQVPIESLRQIRIDFVTIPFQATECRLADISPINKEEGWSEEAINFFKILAQGHVLQANVIGYAIKDNLTMIYLYKLDENHSPIFINEEMVNHGYAQWIEEADYYTLTEVDPLCEGLEFVDLSLVEAPSECELYGAVECPTTDDVVSSSNSNVDSAPIINVNAMECPS